MKISILGCGRWGSFLAWYQNKLNNDVMLFGLENSYSYELLKNHMKNDYVTLDPKIKLVNDLKEALSFADIIIISIKSNNLREFLRKIKKYNINDKKFIFCMKGIEIKTGYTLTQVALEEGFKKENLAVWVGPGHPQDFLKGIPNCMVIDSYDDQLKKDLINFFQSKLIKFYYGCDMIGTEIGAGCKNIFGIVAGILDGAGLTPLKGALMSRGCKEVGRLIEKSGGNKNSAYGLCHLGDYETTLFSLHSNNRLWGELFIKGKQLEKNKLAEGVETTKAVYNLSKKLNIEMPITSSLYNIIYNNINPYEILDNLLSREIKFEFIENCY